jgi:pantothenate kinase
MNLDNKKLYDEFYSSHLSEGGNAPREAATTQLIKYCIENKEFHIYYGGGYYYNHGENKPVKEYDVLCYFNVAGDPYFMMCIDASEGDFVEMVACNPENGKLLKLIK